MSERETAQVLSWYGDVRIPIDALMLMSATIGILSGIILTLIIIGVSG